MDGTTYIVDAATLIDGIHEIKQWIYDGSLRILVPICSLQTVEQQYKTSLVVKEPPQDATPKRVSGRQPRKQHPLFDINPRTAWEFLSRARSWDKEGGVIFQTDGEDFSQWKQEEDARTLKTPAPAPSSFVEAVQRSLAQTASAEDSSATTAPAKPKLVSRMIESKSPWNYHQVPKIDSASVPRECASFFSCVLWRLHEFDNNPLRPIKFDILTNDTRVRAVAQSLKISAVSLADIRDALAIKLASIDHRENAGQLERDFPNATQAKKTPEAPLPSELDAMVSHNSEVELPLQNGHIASEPTPNGLKITEIATQAEKCDLTQKPDSTNHLDDLLESLTQTSFSPPANGHKRFDPFESLTASIQGSTRLYDHGPALSSANIEQKTVEKAATETDSESDEEVIVFNPRANRRSGQPQTPSKSLGTARSRPGTADASGPFRGESLQNPKSPIISTLKPQSPVFTPGQIYTPALEAAKVPSSPPLSNRPNGILPHPPKSPSRSPKNSVSKPASSSQAAATSQSRGSGNDQLQRQQSEMIIKRQREAIQRQTKAAAKPPPRQVQMEPTDNPTVIDPDAFDRSYVVQPPSTTTATTTERGNGRRHGPGRQRHSPKQTTRQTARAGSELDQDFILKSGTPRGASRGKGKLWVP